MAKSSERGYKRYLSSCNVNDVSPRVLRRLNYNPPVERRDPNVEFEEHFGNAADVIENVNKEIANKNNLRLMETENNLLYEMDKKVNNEGELNEFEFADVGELQNVENVGNLTVNATEIRQPVPDTFSVRDDEVMRKESLFMNVNDVYTNDNDIMQEPPVFVNDTDDESNKWIF